MADSLQENGALQLQLHPEPFDPLVVLADWQRSLAAGGTEPYLEDYFRLDLPAALSEAGFVGLRRVASDHRHGAGGQPRGVP